MAPEAPMSTRTGGASSNSGRRKISSTIRTGALRGKATQRAGDAFDLVVAQLRKERDADDATAQVLRRRERDTTFSERLVRRMPVHGRWIVDQRPDTVSLQVRPK